MSVGPLGGVVPSVAGAPFAQSQGSEIDRAKVESSHQERQIRNDAKAEAAEGIAATDGEEKETEERDADGRRLWEEDEQAAKEQDEPTAADADGTSATPHSKDASGMSGNQLDLSG